MRKYAYLCAAAAIVAPVAGAYAQETTSTIRGTVVSGGSPVAIALAGDVVQGRTQYQLRCLNCHRPNNAVSAPVLAGPDNPAVELSDQQLIDLVRTAEGHATPPGPLTEVTISERQLINIIAFIRDQSK